MSKGTVKMMLPIGCMFPLGPWDPASNIKKCQNRPLKKVKNLKNKFKIKIHISHSFLTLFGGIETSLRVDVGSQGPKGTIRCAFDEYFIWNKTIIFTSLHIGIMNIISFIRLEIPIY